MKYKIIEIKYYVKIKVIEFKSLNGRCQISWRHNLSSAKRTPLLQARSAIVKPKIVKR